jgi:hypothetical protein
MLEGSVDCGMVLCRMASRPTMRVAFVGLARLILLILPMRGMGQKFVECTWRLPRVACLNDLLRPPHTSHHLP